MECGLELVWAVRCGSARLNVVNGSTDELTFFAYAYTYSAYSPAKTTALIGVFALARKTTFFGGALGKTNTCGLEHKNDVENLIKAFHLNSCLENGIASYEKVRAPSFRQRGDDDPSGTYTLYQELRQTSRNRS